MPPLGIVSLGKFFFLLVFGLFGFKGTGLVFNPHQFSALSKVVDTCVAIACEFFVVSDTPFQPHPQCSVLVSWHAPPFGWVKINTDDSSLGNPEPARASGLIRDHNGSWICGCSQHVGFASSVLAECWALKDGLSLVTSVGFSNVLIELDAPVVPSFN